MTAGWRGAAASGEGSGCCGDAAACGYGVRFDHVWICGLMARSRWSSRVWGGGEGGGGRVLRCWGVGGEGWVGPAFWLLAPWNGATNEGGCGWAGGSGSAGRGELAERGRRSAEGAACGGWKRPAEPDVPSAVAAWQQECGRGREGWDGRLGRVCGHVWASGAVARAAAQAAALGKDAGPALLLCLHSRARAAQCDGGYARCKQLKSSRGASASLQQYRLRLSAVLGPTPMFGRVLSLPQDGGIVSFVITI